MVQKVEKKQQSNLPKLESSEKICISEVLNLSDQGNSILPYYHMQH